VIICLYNTEILYYIPYCVLGALVESAMMNLISFHEFYHALRIARTSGLVMVSTFTMTLLWSVENGLFYGIIASLALLLHQLSDMVRKEGREKWVRGRGEYDTEMEDICTHLPTHLYFSSPLPSFLPKI